MPIHPIIPISNNLPITNNNNIHQMMAPPPSAISKEKGQEQLKSKTHLTPETVFIKSY